jgi:uncharacterized membrane protein
MAVEPRTNERIIAISDGLFSVALTLLVVSVSIPHVIRGPLGVKLEAHLLALWPRFEIFFISFVVVGFYWHSHHELFFHIRTHDRVLVGMNLLFLMLITLLPFSTSLIGEYENVKLAVDFYSGSMVITSLMLTLLWIYASKSKKLIDPKMTAKDIHHQTILLLYPGLIFFLSLGASFINLRFAKYFWLFIILRGLLARKVKDSVSLVD